MEHRVLVQGGPHALSVRREISAVAPSARHTSSYHVAQGSLTRKVRTLLEGLIAVLHLLVSLALIFLVLLHAGRGGSMGDMFGGGMSGGNVGSSTVVERNLDRLTVALAVAFTLSTFLLTWLLAT